MTEISLDTKVMTLRIRTQEPEHRRLTLGEVNDQVAEITDLIAVSSYIASRSDPGEMQRSLHDRRPGGRLKDGEVLRYATQTSRSFTVGRFTYTSPPDFVLIAGYGATAVAALTSAAYGVVRLWGKFIEVREKHHASQLQIETAKMLREEVRQARRLRAGMFTEATPAKETGGIPTYLGPIITQATEALLKGVTMEIED